MNPIKRPSAGLIIFASVILTLATAYWLLLERRGSNFGALDATPAVSHEEQATFPLGRGAKERSMSAGLASLNHEPITFFGRVVDQNGAPVVGARVTGAVIVQKKWMEGEIERHVTESEDNGRFNFQGIGGRDLSFWFEKPGYRYDNRRQKNLFKYSLLTPPEERHRPDPTAPVTFVFWKEQAPEKVFKWTIRPIGIPADGTEAHFDLLSGQRVPNGGDLVICVTRNPLRIKPGQKYDWTITFTASSGGLAPMHGIYWNEAPAEGYESTKYEELRAATAEWKPSIKRNFYLKSRNGTLYGSIIVSINADYDPPPLSAWIEARVNPNGSRNLEYEGDKTAGPARTQ